MMQSRAGIATWLAGVAAPATLVIASVALLGILALTAVSDTMSDRERYGLFAAGVTCWIVGIGWSVMANDGPTRRAR